MIKEENKERTRGRKIRGENAEYWKCNLFFLEKSIIRVFSNKLTAVELNKLEKFRDIRNFLFHGNLVSLMELLGIPPKGRQITQGKRNDLAKGAIKEPVIGIAVGQHQVLKKVRSRADDVASIFNRLLKECVK